MDARNPRQEANLTDVGGSAQLQAPHEKSGLASDKLPSSPSVALLGLKISFPLPLDKQLPNPG